MKTISTVAILMGALMLAALSAPAIAADQKQELKQRFEQRYPAIREAKTAGKVGETSDGTIEAVKPGLDDASQKLIADENADRTSLYKLLADEEGTTPQLVARRAAARNFDRAKPGDYLKQDGIWRQK